MSSQELAVNLNARQNAFITNYIANGGNGAKAARDAGYREPCDSQAVRILKNIKVVKEINRRQAVIATSSEYTLTQWRADLLADIADAKAAGSHSAVLKGRELLGRHIGALTNERTLSPEEGKYLSLLESAMTQALTAQASQSQALPRSETAIEVSGSIKPPKD